MCQYFSKPRDRCSQSMKQASKEVFENSMHRHDSIKTSAKGYLSNREGSVQKVVYHTLPELKLRIIIPDVYFVNTNLPEEIFQVSFFRKELSKVPDDCPNIFMK